ncbi:hypothetical protein ABZ904_17625 [Streptomyces sp. NPDC046900]
MIGRRGSTRTGVHAALAADPRDSAHIVPGFDHVLDRHRLLSAVEVAS